MKTLLLLLLLSAIPAAAQGPKAVATPDAPVRILDDISNLLVPSLGTQLLAMPEVCTSDGSVFAQTATMSAIGDLTSISADGKTVTNFGVQKINDLKIRRCSRFSFPTTASTFCFPPTSQDQPKMRAYSSLMEASGR